MEGAEDSLTDECDSQSEINGGSERGGGQRPFVVPKSGVGFAPVGPPIV